MQNCSFQTIGPYQHAKFCRIGARRGVKIWILTLMKLWIRNRRPLVYIHQAPNYHCWATFHIKHISWTDFDNGNRQIHLVDSLGRYHVRQVGTSHERQMRQFITLVMCVRFTGIVVISVSDIISAVI